MFFLLSMKALIHIQIHSSMDFGLKFSKEGPGTIDLDADQSFHTLNISKKNIVESSFGTDLENVAFFSNFSLKFM